MVSVTIQGGIANTCFQIAAAYSYALRHRMEYLIPFKNINPHLNQPTYLFPNVNYSDNIPDLPKYIEPSFTYTPIPTMPDVCLVGYFQSFEHIKPYRKEVLALFGFDDIETKKDVCSIHYRASDYKNLPTKHPVISEDYLRKAINYAMFAHYRKFLVFSDDIPEIKKIINSFSWLRGIEFEYSEGKTEYEDLKLMSSCSSQIIANSSFSLWAAYINPNPEKIVIAPRKWFGEDMRHETSTLYLPNTVIL